MAAIREQFVEALWPADNPAAPPPPPRSLIDAAYTAGLPDSVIGPHLAEALGVEFLPNLAERPASAQFLAHIPIAFARQHLVLGLAGPLGRDDQSLAVVLGDCRHWQQLTVLARYLGRTVVPILAPGSAVLAAINQAYQQRSGEAQAAIEQLDSRLLGDGQLLSEVQKLVHASAEDLLDVAARAPVIKLVNLMLFEAVKAGASDLHIQPYEQKLIVRLRIDGVLYDSYELPKSIQEEVVSRVKVMGRMNIAEKRLAQDGRAAVQVGDRLIDLRLASLPTSHGERMVIRLLDKSARLYRLGELGMPQGIFRRFAQLVNLEHGLVLVTGPTGSGKSTTLYAALKEIDVAQHNVLTLEDPIEYQLEGISQTQVSDKKGMTFASGLRSVLRQDPDVIMVGEIRDRETATMAIQSALTGHLVFSTLHTNDAASAVTRLLDLGIEPYLLASSLVGVLAQRLVRKVCHDCGQAQPATALDRRWLGLNGQQPELSLRLGTGCSTCRKTGYRGRVGIFELLIVDGPIRQHVQSMATAAQVRTAALEAGMQSLRQDGITKVMAGLTSIEEVERVTMRIEQESVEAVAPAQTQVADELPAR